MGAATTSALPAYVCTEKLCPGCGELERMAVDARLCEPANIRNMKTANGSLLNAMMIIRSTGISEQVGAVLHVTRQFSASVLGGGKIWKEPQVFPSPMKIPPIRGDFNE